MADANAIYRRVMKSFSHIHFDSTVMAACVIAEAIRNEPDIEAKYVPERDPQRGGKVMEQSHG